MISVELLGFIAGIIIMSAHVPQIVKSIRLKDTHAISLWLYVILFIAVSMWTVYGFFADPIVFLMNAGLLVMLTIMILLKLKYGMREDWFSGLLVLNDLFPARPKEL